MRVIFSVLCFLWSCSVSAQTSYFPPDKELWEAMAKGFAELSMPMGAHQAIQNIMANVQREAQVRDARAKAMNKVPEQPKEDGK